MTPLRQRLTRLLTLCLAGWLGPAVSWADSPAGLSQEQIDDGWIALFDGETLFGWTSTNDAINWQVQDGMITASQGPIGFLVTHAEFGDYLLHVEFRAEPETNAGLFLHTAQTPGEPATECYEVNIAPLSNPFPTGSIVRRQKCPLPEGEAPAADAWQTLEVRVEGGRVTVQLSGEPLCTYVDPHPLGRGRIALQHNSGPIAYRNVRLKPLGMHTLFNGKDLSGWNDERAEESRFVVTDLGELRVLDGRGQLESEGKYDDFLLQLQCRVDGDGLNSGVFFRCIPRDFMMGYECQISNAAVDGDPTRPADCGTGGIFRRQDARRIVAQDRQWFSLTLVANGPQMGAWVDGYPVSDWTDERKPDKNPRRGRREKAGTLAIQGHDPTTDIRFRNIEIQELPDASSAGEK